MFLLANESEILGKLTRAHGFRLEIKFDGYRVLAFKEGKNVKLVSRNQKAFDYPQLLEICWQVAALAVQRVFRLKKSRVR